MLAARGAPARAHRRPVLATLSHSRQATGRGASAALAKSEAHKYLILMRHADSLSEPGQRDHDRPISARGAADARAVARHLFTVEWLPDLLLCSNSRRTKQTVEAMSCEHAHFDDIDSHFFGTLYTVAALDGQTRGHIAERVTELADDDLNQVVMCIGHNRGWEEAASVLAARPLQLQTAHAALLRAEAATWADAMRGGVAWTCMGVVKPETGLEALPPRDAEGPPRGFEPPPGGTPEQGPPAPA